MSLVVQNFENIKSLITNSNVKIIAVSKTFSFEHIKPLVDYGHNHFGENKVQEAQSKWREIKKSNPGIQLHMIGKLQSNKAKEAVKLFDYIHSVDNPKLASLLAKHENTINKKLSYFIQVNIGNENQKSGIAIKALDEFFYYCTKELKLNIIGLMAIPPEDGKENFYFKSLMELNKLHGLKDLSMGMSGDFKEALKYETTFIRIGSSIFGKRA
ncbi:YggS family pyridoxal phosphate-dependent enzyme [Pelagibacteraceae bacterium]|nr:YggS family pyridoxal phosphate-dependent enzyme [Pelagibacteraceae bacterium]